MTTLVTGGTGFLAEGLLNRLDNVRILARSEKGLIATKQQFPEVEIMTGDICDPFVCQKALKGIDTVYHLAAFKHVGLAEKQPVQCIQSNLIGTLNLLKYFKGELFVAISTDKAAQVNGVYGATKYLMERVIAEYDTLYSTKYRVVRYGNVLYSTGSVLCKWRDLMKQGKEVILTDPEATRFFWTVEQAVDLIFECIEKSTDATPHIPEMKAISMYALFVAMKHKYGNKYVTFKEIGLQPGENKHESLDGVTFSNEVEQYTVPEIIELI